MATTQGLPQITPIKLVGAQGSEPLVELEVPNHLRFVPPTVPFGPPQNVGHAYVRMAEAIQQGKQFAPSFEDAVRMHNLLETIHKSSDKGRVIKLV